MVTKTDIIDAVVKAGLKKKDADAAVNAVIATLVDSLAAGEKIQLVGFGSFSVKERAARKGRNPATGKEIEIPASKHITFTAGKGLKDKIN
ncbi:MAG: HU family DNA-binding protein [Ruminococcaceae bacterium]|nr:HU family DNA-binding protein [Oscillospiraceae bacterium]